MATGKEPWILLWLSDEDRPLFSHFPRGLKRFRKKSCVMRRLLPRKDMARICMPFLHVLTVFLFAHNNIIIFFKVCIVTNDSFDHSTHHEIRRPLLHPGCIDGIGPRAFPRQLRYRNRQEDRVSQVLRAVVSLSFF